MKKILLSLIFISSIYAGNYKIVPMSPVEPIEMKTTVLIGPSSTYFSKDCGCDTNSKTHIGATVGLDYAILSHLGLTARITSSWVQTALYSRIGQLDKMYALMGYSYSKDIGSGGVSGGIGVSVIDSFNVEAIATKINKSTIINSSLLYRF